MNQTAPNHKTELLFLALFFAAFALISTSPGATVFMTLLALPSLYMVVFHRQSLAFDVQAVRLCIGGYAMLVAVDFLTGSPVSVLHGTAINYLPIFAVPFIAMSLDGIEDRDKKIDFVFLIAALIAICSGFYFYIGAFFSGSARVAHGINLNQIPFGFICAILGGRFLAQHIDKFGARYSANVLIFVGLQIVVALTFSKLAWGASAVIVFFVLALSLPRRTLPMLVLGFTIACIVFGGLFAAFVPAARAEIYNFAEAIRLIREFGSSEDGSVGARLVLWKIGFAIFAENPVFGVGLGSVKAEAFALAQEIKPDRAAFVQYASHLHNDFIVHLAAFGAFGVIFIAGFFLLIRRIAIVTRSRGNRVFLFSLIPATTVYMSSDVVFNMDALTAAFALILGTSLADQRKPNTLDSRPTRVCR